MDEIHKLADKLRFLLQDNLGPQNTPEAQQLIDEAVNFREQIEMGRNKEQVKDAAKRLENMLHNYRLEGIVTSDFQGIAQGMMRDIRNRIDKLQ